MVDFGHNYWHAMDETPLEKIDLSTKEVGISQGIGDPWTNIKTAVSAGATTVELGFFGQQKGSISSPTGVTPETIGKTKREDIRAMAKLNDVKLSVHAAAGITGVTGLTREQRAFSDNLSQNTIMEIGRAIDFAADTAEGGAVVFHVGEFPRDVTEFKEFRPKYGDWQKEEVASLVNKETGQIMSFQKGQIINEPVWKKNEAGEFLDPNGNIIRDVDENPWKRIPTYDANGKVKFEDKKWEHFEKEIKAWNEKYPEKKKIIAKEFFIATQRSQVERAAPFAFNYMRNYENAMDDIKDLKRVLSNVQELENTTPEKNWFMLRKNIEHEKYFARRSIDVPEGAKPSDFVKKQLKEAELYAQREKEGFMGYSQELEQIEKMHREIVPIEVYGVKRSAEKMAIAAMHAFDVTKKRKLKEAVFVAPENLFPETGWGSHPSELKTLILKSRKEMEKLLITKKNMSEGQAKKTAKEHIKATLDIAHANTWRKYFNKSDKEFNKWMEKQVDDLIKADVIGHVHISDNFGYYDEHLAPGEGNTPIEMFVKKMKKEGKFKGHMIIEPGAQGEGETIFATMTGAWARIAGSPMYRVGPAAHSWTDVGNSYFGRTTSPTMITGQYLIDPKSDDNWWSGTPIE